MRTRLLALVLLVPSVALAQPTEPPVPPTPPTPPTEPVPPTPPTPPAPPAILPQEPPEAPALAKLDVGGPPDTGFQLQARLTTSFGINNLIGPGFSLGYRSGKAVVAAQLGYIGAKIDSGDSSDSASVGYLQPMIYFDVWQSKDGRARMNLVGGVGIGKAKVTSESGGGTSSEISATFVPLLAGLGGDYYLHKNFAIGVELGAFIPLVTGISDNGEDTEVTAAMQSLQGLVRFTFVTGE